MHLSAHSTRYARSRATVSGVELSAIERKILNLLQKDVPLNYRPFNILAKRLGIKEANLLDKIKELKENGIIRSFSAGLNHKRLGFKSTLLALRVPLAKLEAVVNKAIKYPEVTHCFLRQGEHNLYIVAIYKNGKIKKILNKISQEIGKENILNLKTLRQYKLETRLKI